MVPHLKLLGWNEIQVRLGVVSEKTEAWEEVAFDWQPGNIRNCSYSAAKNWLVLTCEDRTNGGQVLALYDLKTKTTSFLQRMAIVLRNAISRAGSMLCYTAPSSKEGVADLYLIELESKQQRQVECALAHDSTPSWFIDNKRVAFHSPKGMIEILRLTDAKREEITMGTHPAVSPDGEQLAFLRDGKIWILQLSEATCRPVEIRRSWLETELLGTLSWSPNGIWLSYGVSSGVTSKESAFYLYSLANQQQHKLAVKYLSSMIIIE